MKSKGIMTPYGMRVFTPDDWIVQIESHDGRTWKKGVQPDAKKDDAVRVAMLNCGIFEEDIANITIRRRRDAWLNTAK